MTNLRWLRMVGTAAAAAVLLCSSLRAIDMTGSTHRLRRTSAVGGGTSKSSFSHRLKSSVGPAAGGRSSSASHRLSAGPSHVMSFPGAVTNLVLTQGVSAGEIGLSWTAPGADGAQATASSYLVKYSTHPAAILTESDFAAAATFSQSLSPGAPGAAQSLTVTGLTPGNSYYIALEARDADGNQAYLSNAPFTWSQVSVLSVEIDAVSYAFGTYAVPTSTVSASNILVSNNGTIAATWSLQASTITAGSPWRLVSGAMGPDDVRLSAAFHGVRPSTSAFSTDDRLVVAGQASTASAFSIDGTSTGVSVPPSQSRNVWFMMDTPVSSSTTTLQLIQVTVTAGP